MSKYETCETKIKVEDKDVLLEAIIRTLKLKWGIDANPQDIEFHDVATNLLGYQGDIRPQKANVIIRGSGSSRHPGVYGPNRLPGLYNDLGFTEKDGFYSMEVQEFQSGQIIEFKDMMLNMINAIKLVKHVAAHQESNPSSYLVNGETGEPITSKEDVINYVYTCISNGKDASIELDVPESGAPVVQTNYTSTEYVPKLYSGPGGSKTTKKEKGQKIKERRWKRK